MSGSATSSARFAIRIGLRYVKGLSTQQGERIERARDDLAFASAEDFAERTGLDEGTVARLSALIRQVGVWDLGFTPDVGVWPFLTAASSQRNTAEARA